MSVAYVLSLMLMFPMPGQQTAPTETLIRLEVQPMAAPRPALRYLLLPDLKEMTPGNPIEAYLASMLDQDFSKDLEVIPKEALRQADRAARMEKPDWQILQKIKTDGFGLLLPDVQKFRALAAGLQQRFRTEVAEGRLDDAVVTAKTMFAMARHMGEHPTLIGALVGIAIAHLAFPPFEEMLAQADCPNFYWALTNLPSPLVSLERGMAGERVLFDGELHDLSDVVPMNAAQLKKVIEHIDLLRDWEEKPRKERTQAWLDARTKDPATVVAARHRLIESGMAESRLLNFPAEQIMLLDEKREYEVRRDEAIKLMNLPTWQVMEQIGRLPRIDKLKDTSLFGSLVPAIQKVRQAQGRLEQRIALLRHVEAIRLYAADHQGKLPQNLTDITVPLPVDPFTGKPFRYSLEGATAHLRGNPPPGSENIAAYNLHYEITIRKPG